MLQTLKGFRDFYAEELVYRQSLIKFFSDLFTSYGFVPLQTPALEYESLLKRKYGEDEKLVYSFEDFGKRRVALRYDLTVPSARFVAQNLNKIKFPWKRYQIQPVWRADNSQRGRYREFYQLDIDTYGTDSIVADTELLLITKEAFTGLKFKNFLGKINSRKLLFSIVKHLGQPKKFTKIVSIIDKWEKQDEEQIKELLLQELDNDKNALSKLLKILKLSGTSLEKLKALKQILKNDISAEQAINELTEIINLYNDEETLKFVPTIARGIDYYTGPIWEWEILDDNIGSVSSGGRYDNLINELSGVNIKATGTSFGIERLIDILMDSKKVDYSNLNKPVLIALLNKSYLSECLKLAKALRAKGLNTIVFPEAKKLSLQLEYANKLGIRYVYILGEDEIKLKKVTLKDMLLKTQNLIAI